MGNIEMTNRHSKYTWVGNRISESDMAKLYRLKQIKKRPITVLVADAVTQFLERECTEVASDNKERSGSK